VATQLATTEPTSRIGAGAGSRSRDGYGIWYSTGESPGRQSGSSGTRCPNRSCSRGRTTGTAMLDRADECWLALCLAEAPPLTSEQIVQLRELFSTSPSRVSGRTHGSTPQVASAESVDPQTAA